MREAVAPGEFVSIFWDDDGCWYDGECISCDANSGVCEVLYTDGERQQVDFNKAKFRLKERLRTTSVRKRLLDIEDRLPLEAVLTSDESWWCDWRARGTSTSLQELKALALELVQQIRPETTTPWWQLESVKWKQKVLVVETEKELDTCLKELTSNALDWNFIRTMWPDEVSSDRDAGKQEQKSATIASTAPRKRGRPRKISLPAKQADTVEARPQQTNTKTNTDSTPKRKRGRPRKSPIINSPTLPEVVPDGRSTPPPAQLDLDSPTLPEVVPDGRSTPRTAQLDLDKGVPGNAESVLMVATSGARTQLVEDALQSSLDIGTPQQKATRSSVECIEELTGDGENKNMDSVSGGRSSRCSILSSGEEAALTWVSRQFKNKRNSLIVYDRSGEPPSEVLAFVSVKGYLGGKPFLIIAPKKDDKWIQSLSVWESNLRTLAYRGPPELLEGSFDVVVTSHGYAVRDYRHILEIDWAAIIVDEDFQLLVWPKSLEKLSLQADFRLLLVGEPVRSSQLLPVLQFLEPDEFANDGTPESDLQNALDSRTLILTQTEHSQTGFV